jgi:bifunctional non-homologous end joining protein LigD
VSSGGEGVVTKKKNSLYIGESRGYWVKVKKESTEDVVILGITRGENKRAPTFGALILGQYDKNGQMKAIGKSSGFTDQMLEKLYKTIMSMPEVKGYPGVDIKDVKRWVAPKMVIEVEYMEKTPYGILRHPRFLRMRDDKTASQCKIL